MKPADFIDLIKEAVIESYYKYGVLPSIAIAQAAVESAWGERSISNNIFGIKADVAWKGPTEAKLTRECLNGVWISVFADFRAYDSIQDSIDDHGKFLTKERYRKVLSAKDYKQAAIEISKAKYATDPAYSKLLIKIIEKYKLYEIDKEAKMGYVMGTPPVQIRELDKLHPKVRKAAELLYAKARLSGISIIITETLRTAETQKEYYSWGRSKINPHTKSLTKVTNLDGYTKKSRHQSSLAFDVCINMPGKLYDRALLTKVGKIGMSLGLTWGGSWKSFQDMPHFEIPPERINSFQIKEEDDEMIDKAKMQINGKEVELERIFKDNRNFVKLDDLKKYGLDVSWDAQKKIPIINIK